MEGFSFEGYFVLVECTIIVTVFIKINLYCTEPEQFWVNVFIP